MEEISAETDLTIPEVQFTSAPIGAWKRNFLQLVNYDRQKNRPSDGFTDRLADREV